MDMTPQEYQAYVKQKAKKSPIVKDVALAFLVGGLICVLGQCIHDYVLELEGMTEKTAAAWTSISLIFLGAFVTGVGWYDNIGHFAGAGSIIPITGFANGIVSSAIEFKKEGFILGLGAKMFTIAGPVIVYGTLASSICGLIYWILQAI